jgi:hypothetical protein
MIKHIDAYAKIDTFVRQRQLFQLFRDEGNRVVPRKRGYGCQRPEAQESQNPALRFHFHVRMDKRIFEPQVFKSDQRQNKPDVRVRATTNLDHIAEMLPFKDFVAIERGIPPQVIIISRVNGALRKAQFELLGGSPPGRVYLKNIRGCQVYPPILNHSAKAAANCMS